MLAKIQNWGNSQGLRLNKQLLEEAHLKIGEEVDVIVQNGEIIIKATSQVRGRYRLSELVAKMPDDYVPEEEYWGPAVGREEK